MRHDSASKSDVRSIQLVVNSEKIGGKYEILELSRIMRQVCVASSRDAGRISGKNAPWYVFFV